MGDIEHSIRRDGSLTDREYGKSRIGLTGQAGAGKSTVAKVLVGFGVHTVDADEAARSVYMQDGEKSKEVFAIFGREILGTDGTIDRSRLRRVVLYNRTKRERLEKVVWPAAKGIVKRKMQNSEAHTVALEAAKLLAAKWSDMVDTIWIVEARQNICLKRILERGLSEDDSKALMEMQTPAEEYRKAPSVVGKECHFISNNGTIGELRDRVDEVWSSTVGKGR